ncbi:MAG: solute carrier family 23 protein [Candidatus Cloacimonetes bacterium]|nr:solute carrier family 23 protein [Candidatus Cloacimonadota bacterium]
MKYNRNLLYEVGEKPSAGISFMMAFQHVILIFSGIVFAPMVISRACGLDIVQTNYLIFAAVIVSGITIIIQVLKPFTIGSGYLLFLGPAASFIAINIEAINLGGLALAAVLTIAAAPVEILISMNIRHLRKILSPVVGGIVIVMIAINLSKLSANLIIDSGSSSFSSNILMGIITFAITSICASMKQKYFKLWAPVLGISGGLLFAIICGITDFSNMKNLALFGLPKFSYPGFSFSFSAQTISVFVIFIIATIISTIETIGDSMAVQEVSHRQFNKVDYSAVKGALNADAFGNVLSGLMGVIPNTTYSGNTPVIKITGVASRFVGIYAGVILIIMSFMPKLTGFFLAIPNPVYGASMLYLTILLFNCGLKLILMNNQLDSRVGFIFSLSVLVGVICEFSDLVNHLPKEWMKTIFGNSISAGGLIALLSSMINNLIETKNPTILLDYPSADEQLVSKTADLLSEKLSLSAESALKTNLVIEEIYEFVGAGNKNNSCRIKLTGSRLEDFIQLEFVFDTSIDDVDINEKQYGVQTWTEEKMTKLGLVLVNKISQSVIHDRIDNYNYITLLIATADDVH